jgi:hypothetical protein
MEWQMADHILRDDIIDIDEGSISLEHGDRKYGKCFISSRINMEGNYGHNLKKTPRLAISGSPEGEAGTSVVDFYLFMLNRKPRGVWITLQRIESSQISFHVDDGIWGPLGSQLARVVSVA